MLLTYWLFHVIFTLPPTILLHFLLKPMLSSRDKFRLIFLVTTAVVYTFPWDSYIITHKAWGYPQWAVLFKIINIPVEEVFFFIIHTVLTSYAYTLFTIPIIPALYIMPEKGDLEERSPVLWSLIRWGPCAGLSALGLVCWRLCEPATPLFYFTAIGFWASPVCAMLWAFGGDHVLRRPRSILAAILLPTAYLCFADTVAISHGTWFISRTTSTGIFITRNMPAEEFVFFAIANVILVLGLAAIEKYDAIYDTWPELVWSGRQAVPTHAPHAPTGFWRQFGNLLQTLLLGARLNQALARAGPASLMRTHQLRRTLAILSVASKSFYSASFIFPNFCAIRAKFVILYGFCRETDDLIDTAPDKEEARRIVGVCKEFIELLWPGKEAREHQPRGADDQRALEAFVEARVPEGSRATFLIFATMRDVLRRGPFEELIAGYEYDSIEYAHKAISNEAELFQYARWVAGSVGEMCVSVMWWVYGAPGSEAEREMILRAANDMGVALQLINIARDIKEDARIGRVYVPADWFSGNVAGLGAAELEMLRSATGLEQFPYQTVAMKLLELADDYQERSRHAIDRLPSAFRPGIRAATKVYMAIGQKIRTRFVEGIPRVASNAGGGSEKDQTDLAQNQLQSVHEQTQEPWNGDRVYLTQFQRVQVVITELWGLRNLS